MISMTTDGKIRVSILESEWRAFPKDKQERIKKILTEDYEFDIHQIIELDSEEGEQGGRN